jgi:orotidine-5'-phosphate decarboxylase
MRFADRLAARVAARESQVVLGLDPDPSRVWPEVARAAPATGDPASRAAAVITAQCEALIAAAGPACVAVKPQVACFERLGAPGWAALERVTEAARAAGLLVLMDGKRGDIDVTAAAYAQAFLGGTDTPFGRVPGLDADALTVNPYLGEDALAPFVASGRGLFVLVRTSNPGAADIQDARLADGGAVWEHVARLVDRLGTEEGGPAGPPARGGEGGPSGGADEGAGATPAERGGEGGPSGAAGRGAGAGPGEHGAGRSWLSDIGAVVGATAPQHLERARELMPRAVFLLPGVGAQGGRVEALRPAFAPGRAAGLVTAARSIARAHEARGGAPAEAARAEAERLRAAAWALA